MQPRQPAEIIGLAFRRRGTAPDPRRHAPPECALLPLLPRYPARGDFPAQRQIAIVSKKMGIRDGASLRMAGGEGERRFVPFIAQSREEGSRRGRGSRNGRFERFDDRQKPDPHPGGGPPSPRKRYCGVPPVELHDAELAPNVPQRVEIRKSKLYVEFEATRFGIGIEYSIENPFHLSLRDFRTRRECRIYAFLKLGNRGEKTFFRYRPASCLFRRGRLGCYCHFWLFTF